MMSAVCIMILNGDIIKKCTHNSILFIDFIIKKMLPPADIFPTKLLHSADIVSVNEWLGLCQKRFDGRI